MIIFEAEKKAGLTEILSAKSSIVYASLAQKWDDSLPISKDLIIKNNKALAGMNDDDLYPTQSILVTTSWNKNDDIFDPMEVWAARNTPEDKPTNLEHDESVIVGHITSNWPIDDEGNIIDENIDPSQLPEKYHILTGSVIYKGYTDPNLKSRAYNLIAEIDAGEKFVSMECFFTGFDYGLVNKTSGSFHVLPRNEETAFLTKHLRAYGGMGEHQDFKIGRILRGITFSGKGFVDRPANPESVIFTKDNINYEKELACIKKYIEKNDDSTNEGVFSIQANIKETVMPKNSKADIVEPEQNTVETTSEVESPATTSTNEGDVGTTTETEVATVTVSEDKTALQNEVAQLKAAVELIKTELSEAHAALAAYKKKEEEMVKENKKAKRLASLISSGIDNDTASATVDKFDSLDDETFATVTSLVASKTVAAVDDEDDEEDDSTTEEQVKNNKASTEVDDSVLETAEVEEKTIISVGSDTADVEIQNTRAALVDFVCKRLNKKNLIKGE